MLELYTLYCYIQSEELWQSRALDGSTSVNPTEHSQLPPDYSLLFGHTQLPSSNTAFTTLQVSQEDPSEQVAHSTKQGLHTKGSEPEG